MYLVTLSVNALPSPARSSQADTPTSPNAVVTLPILVASLPVPVPLTSRNHSSSGFLSLNSPASPAMAAATARTGSATEVTAPRPAARPERVPLVMPAEPKDRRLPAVPRRPAGAPPISAVPSAPSPLDSAPLNPVMPPSRLVPRLPSSPPPADDAPPVARLPADAAAAPLAAEPVMPRMIWIGLASAVDMRSASSLMNSRFTVSPKFLNAFVPSVSNDSKNDEKAPRIPRAASSTTSA